jgi:hypothetical protein
MKATTYLIGLAAAAVIFYEVFMGPLVEPKAARRKIDAERQVESLEQAISSVAYRSNDLSQLLVGRDQLDNEGVFKLIATSRSKIVEFLHPEWTRKGRFTDPWGHDYLLFLQKATNTERQIVWTIRVRSVGPDGVDQNGQGDDITSRGSQLWP